MKRSIIYLLLIFATFSSCKNSDLDSSRLAGEEQLQAEKSSEADVKKGVVRVELSESFLAQFNPTLTRAGVVQTGQPDLDVLAQEWQVKQIRPVFRVGGKFEARQKEAGLHLWYDIYVDDKEPTTRAIQDFSHIEGVTYSGPVVQLKRMNTKQAVRLDKQVLARLADIEEAYEEAGFNDVFDDLLLPLQWHYNNEGVGKGFKPGADINLFPAWKSVQGRSDVIVAVIDGGVDFMHEDLLANMWINFKELYGEKGKDDDENGYEDDLVGYNFVRDSGLVTADDHGTHVAGTIAAVNNNGKGVAGIAGGNGTPGSGAKIMSCQIFEGESGGDASEALVYAADNGAVIAQNSWGFPWNGQEQQLSPDLKKAIDYFVKYAGMDEKGNQVGPMAGGIVIFASGNDDDLGFVMPQNYRNVMSVSAMAPDYIKAHYSNYGVMSNVVAPGGDTDYGELGQILSTLPGNDYGFMQGTSMACPHVSGVAALAIAQFGQMGFTNNDLWNRLIRGTNDIDKFNPNDPTGVGYINAQKVLSEPGQFAPDRVYDLSLDLITFEKARLSWSITADSEYGRPDWYEIVWSTQPLWNVDLQNLPEDALRIQRRVPDGKSVGEKLSVTVDQLEVGEKYYFAVLPINHNALAAPSTTVVGVAPENQAPFIENLPEHIVLGRSEQRTIQVQVYDWEEYQWEYELDAGSAALQVKREGDYLFFEFDALKDKPGVYEGVLAVVDKQGEARLAKFVYTILEDQAPKQATAIPDVLLSNIGEMQTISLQQAVKGVGSEKLAYHTEVKDPSVAQCKIKDGVLEVTALHFGATQVTVTATNRANARTTMTFEVVCRNPNQLVDIYPSPVQKDGRMFIRMDKKVKDFVEVKLYNSSGSRVFTERVYVEKGQPSKVNLYKLSAGNYRVEVSYVNQTHTQTITKL